METEEFKMMLRRMPDSWLIFCFCNEVEMVGVFDLQLSMQDAEARSRKCAKLVPHAGDDLFSTSYAFGAVSSREMLRLLEEQDCWDADWTQAKWTELGEYGAALSFVGVPRVVERAWKETV